PRRQLEGRRSSRWLARCPAHAPAWQARAHPGPRSPYLLEVRAGILPGTLPCARMSLWTITSPSYPADVFGSVYPPETVLFDHDGPAIFVFRTPHEVPVLAYLCDDDETTLRYIAAPTSPQIIERLETGLLPIRAALEQPAMWILDASRYGMVQ